MKKATVNITTFSQPSVAISLIKKLIAVGLALIASIAAGIMLYNWVASPSYNQLVVTKNENELNVLTQSFEEQGIDYRVNKDTGQVYVREDQYRRASSLLRNGQFSAENGFSKSFFNYESSTKEQDNTFTISRSKTLELELARTISGFKNVRSSRVHLAIPEDKGKDTKEARASIVLSLVEGREINREQITAIAHLTASSVSGLALENVIIIDQAGRLLKSEGSVDSLLQSTTQFEYKSKIEADFVEKINKLLTPVLGQGAFNAQVNVELVSTSKNSVDNKNISSQLADDNTGNSFNSSHLNSAGSIKRTTVTVIVDFKKVLVDEDKYEKIARRSDEVASISELVKKAVGFNDKRGDSVEIVNVPFNNSTIIDSKNFENMVSESQSNSVARIFIFVAIVIAVFWIVLVATNLLLARLKDFSELRLNASVFGQQKEGLNIEDSDGAHDSHKDKLVLRDIGEVRSIVENDPKLVAQVIKTWVYEDEQRP